MSQRKLFVVLMTILGGWSVTAQQAMVAFEVASIKVQLEPMSSAYATTGGARVRPGGVFNSSHINAHMLVEFAYDLRPYQVIGGPDWMRQEMFQLEARAGRDATRDEIKLMVRSLLADRFKMVAERQHRDMAVEALVLARPDGRLGPNLRRVDDCNAASRELMKRPPPAGQASSMSACSPALSALATTLSLEMYLGKPVIDATGLDGWYVYVVTSRLPSPEGATDDPRHPSLPRALEEQLGIKLQSRRAPSEVLVISAIERPSPN